MNDLFQNHAPKSGPVECLGQTFPSDEARREHYLKLLAEKLKDPEFRKIEGFPVGSDEDILALSDPPYYTARPNPFTEDFIRVHGKPYSEDDAYDVEPFAADVSEGKGDLLYSAHSYHTKVPPQAIARYILHYTQPGDLVLDPFSGSGMTALAAVLCGSKKTIDPEGKISNVSWGARIPVIGELSPAATLISSVYIAPPNASDFERAAERALAETKLHCDADWQFDGRPVSYFVKAELLGCPACHHVMASAQVVRMTDSIGSAVSFPCAECGAMVSKAPSKGSFAQRLERSLSNEMDPYLRVPVKQRKERTIAVYFADKRHPTFRQLTEDESAVVDRELTPTDLWIPTSPLIQGDRNMIKDCCGSYGISHIHHFYTPRQLRAMSHLWKEVKGNPDYKIRRGLQFFVQSYSLGITRMNRFIPAKEGKALPGSQVNRYFTGTMYIPSMMSEVSPEYLYKKKIERLRKAFAEISKVEGARSLITTQSATTSLLPDNSIDYIFVDPPFGQNLQYSELNQIWESWLNLKTNRSAEAVVDEARKRDIFEYGKLMQQSFKTMYRVLKPGRWVTLEFHNSLNSVWAAIQEGLFSAGFIVADVRVLDKQQDTYKQSRQGLVKKDLVISAYKPSAALEANLKLVGGTVSGAWDFIRNHLRQLPVFVEQEGVAEMIVERQEHMLFDRMLAFHIQRGVLVPLSASEFAQGLVERFSERDGMYFLAEQAIEYDRKRLSVKAISQLEIAISDEESAIQWLKQSLSKKPQSFQELHPVFMREIGGWQKHEKRLELLELLEENFICYEGRDEVPSQIHAYLSSNFKELRGLSKTDAALVEKAKGRWYLPDVGKTADLEKLREKTLLKEFDEYLANAGARQLRVFRVEAIRAGFKKAWQERNYQTIISVARRIPDALLQEDPKLLMWYDQALTRTEDGI